jgi:hypothetical protein
MLQAPRDLSFPQESRTAAGVVRLSAFDLLQSYVAVQLCVVGEKYLTQAPFRMKAEYLESISRRWGNAVRESSGRVRAVVVIIARARRRSERGQRRLDFGIRAPFQLVTEPRMVAQRRSEG